MDLDQVLARLGEKVCDEVMISTWHDAMMAMPARIQFLQSAAIWEYCDWCGLTTTARDELIRMAERIAGDTALLQFSWYCYWRLFIQPSADPPGLWPSLESVLGNARGVFYMLVGLAFVGPLRDYHHKLQVPVSITRETCLQISCFSGSWQRDHGDQIGIYIRQLQWMRNYLLKPYLRLGRFEYECTRYGGGVQVFRHRGTGQTIALAPPGICFDAAGYVARKAQNAGRAETWTSTLARGRDEVSGYAVSPYGTATRWHVHLSLKDWECVLEEGTPVLMMHIPAGGNMNLAAAIESMQRAACFFPEHFSAFGARAIVCSSWLFNTDLERILKPEANLPRLQRELYLYPINTHEGDGLWYIFLQDKFDPTTAPRDTSMQRSILTFLQAGNFWRSGAMFVLLADIARLGTEHYRAHWPPQL